MGNLLLLYICYVKYISHYLIFNFFCRIDDTGVIKIADFGLCENIYSKNYFRQESHSTVRLPIKWMAIESLQEGIFSEKTDVVCLIAKYDTRISLTFKKKK